MQGDKNRGKTNNGINVEKYNRFKKFKLKTIKIEKNFKKKKIGKTRKPPKTC